MLANDYSQLPVMTSEREVKGMISWASIGTRLAVGRAGNHVRELMDGHHEIRAELSLFQAIPIIVEHQYVLVRGNDNRMDKVREIRNDVMHFDPDGILPTDLERLRDFANFLQRLQTIGVP
jgi:predicted transcriptional regulator